ncbi:acetate--CoA ligase family protein [Rhodobacteraceae bacterium HSP-20]|uniref:Acetate--CoA ligase family protein n=1 Tax=Paragemmobacter amnigenus TaxID=2852097 RepID=A0ABS6JAB8_9RHOB|nr:acetate--CoA ligase family protein [Rhodobacter amnigenus]MBU9699839.1 acetate--CoA ligase family protein [Rhodobacter amnigenus]MBV4391066.1 acetate--CoA ligase family protein [Rhodobacter amnigenus]
MRDLTRLLRPRSIAVLGSGWAANVVEQCRKMGFDGPVWPVHPSRDAIAGAPCFRTLADLPHAPDATFIGVNRHATLDVVAELAAMGAGGATCFASGWEEAGEADLQAKLVQAAGDMPILGPNCYGVINYLDGALLWPDQHGGVRCDRGVALLSQSSNIVINLTMQARALPVAYVACLGNAAQTGLAELANALLSDDRVTALGMYVEGIDDAAAFADLAERARAAGKGIVCIKSGKTELSRTAAASHTASLAGGGAASSAFLRACGVAEVATPAELIETLKIFHHCGPQIGPRLCSLSCSGGEAGLVADLAAPYGVDFPPPSDAQRQRLGDILGPIVAIANPLDYHTFIWGDGPRTTDVFTTMLAGYDAGIFIIDPPRPDRCDPSSFQPALDAITAAATATGKPAFAVASLPENFDETLAARMAGPNIVPMMGFETALAAIRAAQTPPNAGGWRPWPRLPQRPIRMRDEASAKALIAAVGVTVPRAVTAATLAALAPLAATLTPPLALKGLGFAHKTEAGAVRLNLHSLDGQPDIQGAQGYLAEEMVTAPIAELLIGFRRDPVYGATLTLGFGGTTAELLADIQTLILPVTATDIDAALRRLRLWPLLDGYRGRPKADTAAAIATVLSLQSLFHTDDRLEEIEINPLILRAQGAVAVDAVLWESAE